jgi:hypothetical protein
MLCVGGCAATQYGGGIALGAGGGTAATCACQIQGGTVLAGNWAGHAGSSLYMACSADLLVQDTVFTFDAPGSQVREGGGGTLGTGSHSIKRALNRQLRALHLIWRAHAWPPGPARTAGVGAPGGECDICARRAAGVQPWVQL